MRFISAIATLLLASTSFAFPEVGDWAKYDGQFITPDEKTIQYELTQELISFDEEKAKFTMRVTSQAVGGEKDVQLAEIDRSALVPTQRLKAMVIGCMTMNVGGQGVMMPTPAGAFPGCMNYMENGGYIVHGIVPFGVLKSEIRSDKGIAIQVIKAFGGAQ